MFGISRKDFEVLCTTEVQHIIDNNIEKEPSALALKGVSAVVCNQVKYLQRCRTKIPHYYEARCIIPPVSYEQSSSKLATIVKQEYGKRLLDLTCGLGVDSHHYSKLFTEVVTIERDELIADIARENFKRLKTNNITVINSSCEEFLENYSGEPFDMIYVDPARRDTSKRLFLLEDCSPDIRSLLPIISKLTKRLKIKLSPLFDIEEAERIFGKGVTLRAVSVGGECKELCVEIDFDNLSTTKIIASSIGKDGDVKECIVNKDFSLQNTRLFKKPIENYCFISILDVALRKMRCGAAYYAKYHNDADMVYDGDVALWSERTDVVGKMYEIKRVLEYKPKLIKELGIKSATIIIQNFDVSMEDLRKRLGIKSGSSTTLIFTTIKNKQYMFEVC